MRSQSNSPSTPDASGNDPGRGGRVFEQAIGPLLLENGQVLTSANLVYKTYGAPNAERDNAIVVPTSFGTTHEDFDWLVGSDKALDPSRFFIVIVNLFGSSLSSSPSRHGRDPGSFPAISMRDNVRAQGILLREVLGMRAVQSVVGFSMGAQAAYHWASEHPEIVKRIAVVCGSARTSMHNYVFLEGVKAALTSDISWKGDVFGSDARDGLRRMGRVYAGWGLSPEFYRRELFRDLGHHSVEEFIVGDWEARFLRKNANDLLSMLHTWQNADISKTTRFAGDLPAALAAIEAEVLLMPSSSDQYFTIADSETEASHLRDVRWRPVMTDWGHRVNVPEQNPVDAEFVGRNLRELLD